MNLPRSSPFTINLCVVSPPHQLPFLRSNATLLQTFGIAQSVCLCMWARAKAINGSWIWLRVLIFFFFSVHYSRFPLHKCTAIKTKASRDQIVWMTKWDWFSVNNKTFVLQWRRLYGSVFATLPTMLSYTLRRPNLSIRILIICYVLNFHSYGTGDATYEHMHTNKPYCEAFISHYVLFHVQRLCYSPMELFSFFRFTHYRRKTTTTKPITLWLLHCYIASFRLR